MHFSLFTQAFRFVVIYLEAVHLTYNECLFNFHFEHEILLISTLILFLLSKQHRIYFNIDISIIFNFNCAPYKFIYMLNTYIVYFICIDPCILFFYDTKLIKSLKLLNSEVKNFLNAIFIVESTTFGQKCLCMFII